MGKRPAGLWVTLILCSAAAGCSDAGSRAPTTTGALEILLTSDMAIPKDIDHVRLDVSVGGESLLHVDSDAGDGALLIPASFKVKGNGSQAPVHIEGVAYKDGQPRVRRDAITPIPVDQIGKVRLPLNYLCDGSATAEANGEVGSTCPKNLTCVEGECASSVVRPSDAAGNTSAPDGGVTDGCFDAPACFDTAQPANLDESSCVLAVPNNLDLSQLNVALQFPPGGPGVCGKSGCYVVLDRGSGFDARDGQIILASGPCSRPPAKGGAWVFTTSCFAKTTAVPLCGSWSSVTTPVKEPPAPPPILQSCNGPSTEPCGNCGTATRPCVNGVWGEWSACSNEGVCTPGTSQTCKNGGAQLCSDACEYGACTCPDGQVACGADGVCTTLGQPHACADCDDDCAQLDHVSKKGLGCEKDRCTYVCADGYADCDGKGTGCSTDLADVKTCGACGNDCTHLPHVTGKTSCVDGACDVPASSCAAGYADCNSKPDDGCETDLKTAEHCGSCTLTCSGATPICDTDKCVASCGSGRTACGTQCVDVLTDDANCGACGTVCPANRTCSSGVCGGVCGKDQTLCNDQQPETCDATGQWKASGSACGAAQTCVDGACIGACGPGQTETQACGTCNLGKQTRACTANGTWSAWGACAGGADLQKDNANCGACGNACAAGSTCTAGTCPCSTGSATQACGTCNTGVQRRSCLANGTWGAFGACSGGTNLQTDSAHCGSCSNACTSGVSCVNGTCPCGTGSATQACGTCNKGLATRSCNANGTWSAFGTCTGGADLQSDEANCGSCGHACASGITCQSGVCACTSPTSQSCGTCGTGTQTRACNSDGTVGQFGQCTGGADLQSDEANCGSCGNACASGITCQSGVCACTPATQSCGTCSTGTQTASCNPDGTLGPFGTCSGGADTSSDPNNCGSCGFRCATGGVCSGGACSCPGGTVNCRGTCSATCSPTASCADGGTGLTWAATGGQIMNWYDANAMCSSLGAGWRLPTQTEISHWPWVRAGQVCSFTTPYNSQFVSAFQNQVWTSTPYTGTVGGGGPTCSVYYWDANVSSGALTGVICPDVVGAQTFCVH